MIGLVHDRRMFDLGGDHMPLARGLEGRPDGHVVAFGAATGENDFLRRAAEQRGDFLARLFDMPFDELAETVSAGRIAVVFGQEWHHDFKDFRRDARSGVVIKVNDFGVGIFFGTWCVHKAGGQEQPRLPDPPRHASRIAWKDI